MNTMKKKNSARSRVQNRRARTRGARYITGSIARARVLCACARSLSLSRKDAFESLIPFETLILGGKMGENERVFFVPE